MTIARKEHNSNVVLGAGEIWIDLLDSNDALQGERYLGDSVGATLALTTERTTIQSGDGQVARDLVDIVRSVSRTIGFTLRDMSIENWRLFLIAASKTPTTYAAVSAAADLPVSGGSSKSFLVPTANTWWQIGATAENPSGIGEITALGNSNPVTRGDEPGDSGAKPKTNPSNLTRVDPEENGLSSAAVTAAQMKVTGETDLGADEYVIDLKSGRIKVGSGTAGKYIGINGTMAAKSIKRTAVDSETKQLTCALRYIEDAAAGASRNVFIRKCNLVPAGEMQLKSRDTEQQMAFTATIQASPDAYPDVTLDDADLEPAA